MDERLRRVKFLERTVADLITQHEGLTDIIRVQAESITELRIANRFLMDLVKVRKPGISKLAVGLDGRPIVESVSAFDIFHNYDGRARTLDVLQRELDDTRRYFRAQEMKHDGDARELQDIIDDLRSQDDRDREQGRESDRGSDAQPAEEPAQSAAV